INCKVMGASWLFRPLPLRERVRRGVAPASSTLRTRRLVVSSPPHPNPLPRGEREPEVPSTKGVIANSTVLPLSCLLQAFKGAKGIFLIVLARCLVCGKPVCLSRAIYQGN